MAGPLEGLVERIQRRVSLFAEEQKIEHAMVEVELFDGALIPLRDLHPEPGYGFLTLLPSPSDGEEPHEVIVPVGAIRQFTIRPAEPEGPRFGFAATALPH